MESLGKYARTAGAVRRVDLHLVWCPTYRRPVLEGRAADGLRSLIQATCTERDWTVEVSEILPNHVQRLVRTGPDAAPALVAHQCRHLAEQAARPEKGGP